MRFDITEVKNTASNRWQEILTSLGGVNPSLLDGNNHPCPKHCHPDGGGKDRFRFIDKSAGSLLCNRCFDSKNGDGIAAIGWLLDIDFKTSLQKIAEYLGIKPQEYQVKSRGNVDPAKDLEFTEWNSQLARLWCLEKSPITEEALLKCHARQATYTSAKEKSQVIAIPTWTESPEKPVGWTVYNITGGTIARQIGRKVEQVKVKVTYGSKAGLIGPGFDSNANEYWKTEGPTDLLAFLSLKNLPGGVTAFCNANGAKEDPVKFSWLPEKIAGKKVYVVHDCDEPGQHGATEVPRNDGSARPGWCPFLAGKEEYKTIVKNIVLPYDIAPTSGKDLRDWIKEGNQYQDFSALKETAKSYGPIDPENQNDLLEADDDPHRLARVNLAQFQSTHGGRLVFWRDEYWKYKSGCYSKIEPNELKAKLTANIRKEFEHCFRTQEIKPNEEKKPVKKVTRSLITNVIGATESMVTQSGSVMMPSWLPDRSQRNYLSMKNGILDLDAFFREDVDNLLIPHSPNWFSSLQLDYNFEMKAEMPKWREYIKFVVDGDQEKINLLQEWAGYLLWPSAERQSFLVFEGEGGTGKSSFFAGMAAMLGESNISSLSLEDLGDSFGLASTVGKVANIAGDVGAINGNEEAILKRYTGGDKVEIQRKFLPSLSLRPTAKMMMAWNTRPRFKDKSEGLWRRMILVPLNNQVGTKRVFGMDNPKFWADEAPGIMLWALMGLKRLTGQNGFSRCQATVDAIDEFKHEVNPASSFFEDYVLPEEEGFVESHRLYVAYKIWCKSTGHHALSDRAFGKQLRKFFPVVERKKIRVGKKLFWRYEKISCSDEEIFGKDITERDLF